jgi:hypothetical protein
MTTVVSLAGPCRGHLPSEKALEDSLSDVISIENLNTGHLAVNDIQDEHALGRM